MGKYWHDQINDKSKPTLYILYKRIAFKSNFIYKFKALFSFMFVSLLNYANYWS